MVAQRFGDQFDGIVAGDPGSDLPKAWPRRGLEHAAVRRRGRAQGLFETTGPGAGTTPLLNAAVSRPSGPRCSRDPGEVRRGRRPGRRHGQQDLLLRSEHAGLRRSWRTWAGHLPAGRK